MGMDMGVSYSASKSILDGLETVELIIWKTIVERVTIVKTSVDKGSGNERSGGQVKCVANTTEITDEVMARAGK